MVKEYKTNYILLLLLLLIVVALFIVFNFNENTANAETTDVQPAMYVTEIVNGELKSTNTGMTKFTAEVLTNVDYRVDLGSVSDTTSGLGYYFKTYNATNIIVYRGARVLATTYYIENDHYYIDVRGQPSAIFVYRPYYKISYELNEGTLETENIHYVYADSETYTYLNKPTRDGYQFIGWFSETTYEHSYPSIKGTKLSGDITLYACWSELTYIPVYNVTHDYYKKIYTQIGTVGYYDIITQEMYRFTELIENFNADYNLTNCCVQDKNDNNIKNVTSMGNDFCLKSDGVPDHIAIYNTFYSIKYELNGGTKLVGLYNYYNTKSELCSSSLPIPFKYGYKFIGYYLDENFTSTPSSSDFVASDVTLYAKFSELKFAKAYYKTTDFYKIIDKKVDSISYYEHEGTYYYSEDLNSLVSKVDGATTFSVISTGGSVISLSQLKGNYISLVSSGVPDYIQIDSPTIYSISYIFNGGKEDPDNPLYHYYISKYDVAKDEAVPIMDGYEFISWYLDSDFTTSTSSSEFKGEKDIVLYAQWSEKHPISVYYYNTGVQPAEYEYIGDSYYHLRRGMYCYGKHDGSTGVGYYYNKYDATSFFVYNENDKKIKCFEYNGYLFSSAEDGIPTKVYIYKHYSIKYYVNGIYYMETAGGAGDEVKLPTFVKGFIGQNYDAVKIGSLNVGKDYALYIFKGWSATDTSDITWFQKQEVDLVDSITYGETGEYVISLYAYMQFYGKLNSLNNEIDYEEYINSCKGIIRDDSTYSLDDLMQEHVTMTSADTQKTVIDKITSYLNIDDISLPSLSLIEKLFSGKEINFNDIFDSIIGKILLGIILIVIIYIILYSIFLIFKNIFMRNYLQTKQ